ncbi:MAG: type II secretion system protein GspK [Candidatus Theseobacter exili]|nr:type II secretion system protein GspK [Candidatus Theseobacter exili]
MKTSFKNFRSQNNGAVLIIIMWIIAILSLMASGLAYRASVEAKLTGYRLRQMESETEAKASINKTLFNLRTIIGESTTSKKTLLSLFCKEDIGSILLTTSVSDEERKININMASRELLLEIPGLDEDTVDSLLDWIDKDEMRRPDGAEKTYYRRLNDPYPCKNDKLETVYELNLIKGFNDALIQKIRNTITVFGVGKVNINTAPTQVLNVLGFDEMLADKIYRYRLGEDGEDGTEDDGIFEDINDIIKNIEEFEYIDLAETAMIENAISNEWICVKSTCFSVETQATGLTMAKKVIAVVTFDEDNKIKILSWQIERLASSDTAYSNKGKY